MLSLPQPLGLAKYLFWYFVERKRQNKFIAPPFIISSAKN
jgi:hypothetical protein